MGSGVSFTSVVPGSAVSVRLGVGVTLVFTTVVLDIPSGDVVTIPAVVTVCDCTSTEVSYVP